VTLALDLAERSSASATAIFALTVTVPILLKWSLLGRWQRTEIPVWSSAYFRFWLVKTAIRSNPMRFFVGSPLYVLYLRALGAKIGKDVLILADHVPVCTDLLTVGDGTVILKDVNFDGYRAHSGVIQTGRITIGRNVFVGGMSVLDIETSLGDGAQLGYTSSLYAGQEVPAGETWHGTPARQAEVDYSSVQPVTCTTTRKLGYTFMQLLMRLVVYPSLAVGVLELIEFKVRLLADPLDPNAPVPAMPQLLHEALGLSTVTYFGGLATALVFIWTVPKLLGRLITPDRVYPVYGFHYALQRTIARLTNNGTLTGLFGDSSYIVGYLRNVGYDLGEVQQTGSNFGMAVGHDNPYLCSIGTGTLVSDGLSLINAAYSNSSFKVSAASVGARNFVGNGIAFPAGGRVGDNCLLATKVMIPMHGEVRENVGLLGSPSFEIPRSVRRDGMFEHLKDPDELRERLSRKNRHNLATIAIHLAVRWVFTFITTAIGLASLDSVASYGAGVFAAASVMVTVLGIVYYILVERLLTGFRGLQPQVCSIYEPYFWWHERYWKVPAMGYIGAFSGTPFKGLIWRLLGAKVGRRLFDDGCWMTERPLVTIGDHCTLGATSTIQAHSLEDGAFKSDHITIGSHSTLATHAFVHYGVTMGESSVLGLDSFLMKGETMAPGDMWLGNPARPPHAVTEETTAEPDGYLSQLLRHITALESKIDQLAERRPHRNHSGALAAACLALLATAGAVTITTHPALATSLPAAWNTLLSGADPGAANPAPARKQRGTTAQPQHEPATETGPDSSDDTNSQEDPDSPHTQLAPVQGITHLQPKAATSKPNIVPPRPTRLKAVTPPSAPTTPRKAAPTVPLRPAVPSPDTTTPPSKPQAQAEVKEARARLKQAKAALKQAKAAGSSTQKKAK
jgi:non-ribosomal peptide synthetase-like protein